MGNELEMKLNLLLRFKKIVLSMKEYGESNKNKKVEDFVDETHVNHLAFWRYIGTLGVKSINK